MTLYDKIKNMTVDEMAEHFCIEAICCGGGVCKTAKNCRECWLDYLNHEQGSGIMTNSISYEEAISLAELKAYPTVIEKEMN